MFLGSLDIHLSNGQGDVFIVRLRAIESRSEWGALKNVMSLSTTKYDLWFATRIK